MRPHRPVARTAILVLLGALALSGCGSSVAGNAVVDPVSDADRTLVDAYVAASNRAGDAGPEEQLRFLRANQEPGVPPPPDRCFEAITVRTRVVERTLRPATPDWRPSTAAATRPRPQGAVYVVAASASVMAGGVLVREDVESDFLVIRDGRVYGYAMCRA